MRASNSRAEERAQLSLPGVVIGIIGCIIITASSIYTALKMGALPWPSIFTSITALVALRAIGRNSLNEANVTQIIMSAGSMVTSTSFRLGYFLSFRSACTVLPRVALRSAIALSSFFVRVIT